MLGQFADASFLLHVTQREGRGIEQLLALQGDRAVLGGAIVEASYSAADPPLLARLAESRIPWVVDPQSIRFSSSTFLAKQKLAALPYTPSQPLVPNRFTSAIERMTRMALEFQAAREPSMYMVPALPLPRASIGIFRTFASIHNVAAELNGNAVPYRPLLAAVYPSLSVMRGRYSVVERLDRRFDGAYVLPLQVNPRRDSVERLVAYVRFLQHIQSLGLSVVAGRAGAFGLILVAAGIEGFDSGLGDRESFNLTALARSPKLPLPGKKEGGPGRRVYLAKLKSTLTWRDADQILELHALNSDLMCAVGECRFGGYRYALDHPREHFFHSREAELSELRSARSPDLRVQLVMSWLWGAQETARLVNRLRAGRGQAELDFEHLDRWRGVLARLAAVAAVRGQ